MRNTLGGHERDRAFQLVAGGSADEFAWASKAPATWIQYASALRLFDRWCEKRGLSAIPADVDTVRQYLRHLVTTGRTVSSVETCLTAITTAHRLRGLSFDRASLRDTLKGIRRARGTTPRQAKPILTDDLRGLLGALDATRAVDARDGALLAIGWAGALRQSEIIALDWARQGDGDGFLVRDRRGITITLRRSKTSQAKPVTIIIPAADMPTACEMI